jgi:hypothetical protein
VDRGNAEQSWRATDYPHLDGQLFIQDDMMLISIGGKREADDGLEQLHESI